MKLYEDEDEQWINENCVIWRYDTCNKWSQYKHVRYKRYHTSHVGNNIVKYSKIY